jgi:hypothetical protein
MIRSRVFYLAISAFVGLGLLASPLVASAKKKGGKSCNYMLNQAEGGKGQAEIRIDKKKLRVVIDGAERDTLYTVWIDFRMRSQGKSKPPGFPPGVPAVSPAIPTDKGVTNGIGLDRNGIMTDKKGRANVIISLNYELLKAGSSPVVGGLARQGLNVVGGFWMRQYSVDPLTAASSQNVTKDFKPELVYSTAAGITMVRHPDTITHGHSPGNGDVDFSSAWSGDFPNKCLS